MTKDLHNQPETLLSDPSVRSIYPLPAAAAHTGKPESLPEITGALTETSAVQQHAASADKPARTLGSKARMAAFSLMLVVPVALTGCGDDDDYCEYDQNGNPYNCDDDYSSGSHGGSYFFGGYSSSHKSSSSGSHSGFGSSGSSSSFFGG
ncbi:hypothetical protein [Paenibacillus bovis]